MKFSTMLVNQQNSWLASNSMHHVAPGLIYFFKFLLHMRSQLAALNISYGSGEDALRLKLSVQSPSQKFANVKKRHQLFPVRI